jgi:hypothetical protein
MPKIGREKLQHPTTRPGQLLAFYFGEQLQKHLGHKAPPLKWCSVAALFAIQGEHSDLHKVYPDWLASSFVKRKAITVYSLDWCLKKFDQFISKYENEAMTTALFCAMDNYCRIQNGERIDSQDLAATAEKYGWNHLFTDDTLTKAAKKVDALHKRFEAFRCTPAGHFWGEF